MGMKRYWLCAGMSVAAFFYTGLRVYVREFPESDPGDVMVRGRVIGISTEDAQDVATAYTATRRGCALIAYHRLPESRKEAVREEAAAYREQSAKAKFFALADWEIIVALALSDHPGRSPELIGLGKSALVQGGLISSASAFLLILPFHMVLAAHGTIVGRDRKSRD